MYFTLFGIGSPHSYIASTIYANLGISIENTAREFSLISHLGQSVHVDKVSKRVPSEI